MRAGRQAGEQIVHLPDRALQGRDHVGAEFGIVGVALGVARDQAQLAHQILDVVHDEGEAAVELVEALGVGERLLAARLGDIGGGLDAGGAEQVEILPVEPPAEGRVGEDDEAGDLAAMDQRHAGPGVVDRGEPCGHGDARLALDQPAVADRVEIDHEAARFDMAEQRLGAVAGGDRHVPVPAAGRRQAIALVADHEQAAGRAADVGERLDHPLLDRRAGPALVPDRVGEAQPFLAIIVAMLEQMLGEHDPEPGAQLGRRQQDQSRQRHHEDDADLADPRPVAADDLHRPRRQHHRDQISEDDDQRDRLEGRGPRDLDLPGRVADAEREQGRERGEDQAAQREQLRRPARG